MLKSMQTLRPIGLMTQMMRLTHSMKRKLLLRLTRLRIEILKQILSQTLTMILTHLMRLMHLLTLIRSMKPRLLLTQMH